MSKQLLDAVPLTTLSGVGAAISDKLSRIGIHNLQDLLFHLPMERAKLCFVSSILMQG